MANHALPTVSSTYANYTAELDGRLDDLALGLDPATTSPTNVPTSAVRWNSAATRWEKWNGTSWVVLSSLYAVNISGNAATATALATARTVNGVSFNGTANITVTANTPNTLTFNGLGAGASSGTAFNGGTALTISYNTLGATSFGWSLATAASAEAARTTLGTDVYKSIPIPSSPTVLTPGEMATVNAGFTINTGSAAGTVYPFYNNSALAITITQGVGLTLRLAGTTSTGNRTLAARGLASIWCLSTTEYVISGAGVY